MSEKVKRKIHYSDALMKALHFTGEDVEANREGYLSKSQRRCLLWEKRFVEWGGTLFAIILLAIISLTLLAAVSNVSASAYHSSIQLLCLSLWIPMALVMILKTETSRIEDEVSSTQGYIALNSKHNDLTVSGYTFNLDSKSFDAFESNGYYRIYFISKLRRIVAVEQIIEW